LKVDLPSALSHTVTSCSHWTLSAGSLGEAPTTDTGTLSDSSSSPTYYCSFETALEANTAYGLALVGSGAAAGIHAPVAL
jgi:hypothetical protein